jgi:phosphoribosyl-AMP cyclohydrolase
VSGTDEGVPVSGADDGVGQGAPELEAVLAGVRWNPAGLAPAVVQDSASRDVLMVAWMDRTALRRTLETGRTWFYSRSRNEYWCKGETSGNRQWVREVRLDCDGDTILVVADQEGQGACHTGAWTCFFRRLGCGPGRPAVTGAGAEDGGRAR